MLVKLRIVLWLIIVAFVAYFVSLNMEPKLSINILPDIKTPEYPIGVLLVFGMVVGAVIVWALSLIDWIHQKIEKRKLHRELEELREELSKCKKENEELKDKVDKLEGLKSPLEEVKVEENEIPLEKEEKTREVEESGSLRQGLHEGEKSKEPSEKDKQ